MNDQVVAVVESDEAQKKESCSEGGDLTELGSVSKDTQGMIGGFADLGPGRQW